eukprot:GGOE01056982.1.p1 GENE.GGOE01056982.1~~GGOE01056982.1.p1  ORF type:complete len:492 (+),score=149.10 GGOE01056982.1:73-1548(+)
MNASNPLQYLLVDTNAIIAGGDFWQRAPNLITVEEVLLEVQDKKSLTWLTSLPVKFETRNPDAESLLTVMRAARELGDYGFLSKTDIKLLALAYQYARDHDPQFKAYKPPESEDPPAEEAPHSTAPPPRGVWGKPVDSAISFADMIRQAPNAPKPAVPVVVAAPVTAPEPPKPRLLRDKKPTAVFTFQATKQSALEEAKKLGEGGAPDISSLGIDDPEDDDADDADEDDDNDVFQSIDPTEALRTAPQPHSGTDEGATEKKETGEEEEAEAEEAEGSGEEDEEGEEDFGGSDGEGEWITPENVHEVGLRDAALTDAVARPVALLTTDFPMQNVGMHLGIHLVAINGMAIAYLKQWILRCHGCYTLVTDTTRQFCPQCGSGDTLKKVSYTRKPDGEIEVWINPKKQLSIKHTIKKLHAPISGKRGTNKTQVLREDQLRNCGRVYNRERDDKRLAALWDEEWTFGPKKEAKKVTHLAPTMSYYKGAKAGGRRR